MTDGRSFQPLVVDRDTNTVVVVVCIDTTCVILECRCDSILLFTHSVHNTRRFSFRLVSILRLCLPFLAVSSSPRRCRRPRQQKMIAQLFFPPHPSHITHHVDTMTRNEMRTFYWIGVSFLLLADVIVVVLATADIFRRIWTFVSTFTQTNMLIKWTRREG